jgi:hypothetical protein
MNRRQFLKKSSTALVALSAVSYVPTTFAAEKAKRVGLIGAGWYGKSDLWRLAQVAPIEIVSLCDPDKHMLAEAVEIAGRRYVDGGFRGALPIWAAEELGATRAVALNVLNTPGFRLLHSVMRGKRAGTSLKVVRIEPSRRLGSLRDALRWNAANIERWIAQGEQDAKSIPSHITM